MRKRYENIEDHWDELSPETRQACQKVMSAYGNNKWWRSQDPAEVAMYQMFEDLKLTDFSLFQDGLEILLDRPVFTHELGLNRDGLREEVKQGVARYLQGMGVTDEYRKKAVQDSIQMLKHHCERKGLGFEIRVLERENN